MKRLIKRSLPILIVVVSVTVYAVMRQSAARPIPRPPETPKVIAPYIEAHMQRVSAIIRSQGTVEPSLRTELMAQVAGSIAWVADGFHTGGYFEKGALLLQIESKDYEAALIQTEAVLAQAKLNLETEKAQARQAEKDWKALNPGNPTPLAMRRPQLAQALAQIRAAQASVEKARRDVDKTQIRAPYPLKIHSKQVDLHQYVTPGTPLANVFAVEEAEIRLPVTDEEMALLEMPMGRDHPSETVSGPSVALRARIAGRWFTWQGNIVRAEGIYDVRTRVTHVVARVDDPYGFENHRQQPLAMGMFVEAQIQGKQWTDRIVLPQQAMYDSDTIWILNADDTIRRRKVGVLYADSLNAVIDDGISRGDKVCLNRIEYPTDGMAVNPTAVNVANEPPREVRQ